MSMCGFQAFITITRWTQEYEKFLEDLKATDDPATITSTASDNTFLNMTEFGPFDIQKEEDLQKFFVCLVILREYDYDYDPLGGFQDLNLLS